MNLDKSSGVWARAWVVIILLGAAPVVARAAGVSTSRSTRRKAVHRVSGVGGHHKPKRPVHRASHKNARVAAAPAGMAPVRPRRWHPGLDLAFRMAGRQVPGR
jgi:hypothetical protein